MVEDTRFSSKHIFIVHLILNVSHWSSTMMGVMLHIWPLDRLLDHPINTQSACT